MKTRILYIIILLTTVFSFGCKKRFPDGPLISFRSVKERIHGTWKVDKFYINGADSTDEFNAKIGCEIEFTKYTKDIGGNCILKNCNNGKTLNGGWGFWVYGKRYYEKSELLVSFPIDSIFTYIPGPFEPGNYNEGWYILRLTEKELNVKTFATPFWGVPASTQYVINLKKQ